MTALSMVEKAFLLKKTALFAELELDLLLTISEQLATVNCEKDDELFKQGNKAHRMYFLIEGCVEVINTDDQTLTILHPVDYFGDESLFNDAPRGYGVRCIQDCLLLTLSRSDLLHIIAECPSVGVAMLRAYSCGIDFRQRKAES